MMLGMTISLLVRQIIRGHPSITFVSHVCGIRTPGLLQIFASFSDFGLEPRLHTTTKRRFSAAILQEMPVQLALRFLYLALRPLEVTRLPPFRSLQPNVSI